MTILLCSLFRGAAERQRLLEKVALLEKHLTEKDALIAVLDKTNAQHSLQVKELKVDFSRLLAKAEAQTKTIQHLQAVINAPESDGDETPFENRQHDAMIHGLRANLERLSNENIFLLTRNSELERNELERWYTAVFAKETAA